MTPDEHAREAERWLDKADDLLATIQGDLPKMNQHTLTSAVAMHASTIAVAQVHATLSTRERQSVPL